MENMEDANRPYRRAYYIDAGHGRGTPEQHGHPIG